MPGPLHADAGLLRQPPEAFERGVGGLAHEIVEDDLEGRPGIAGENAEQRFELGIVGLLRGQRALVLVVVEIVGRQPHRSGRQRIVEQLAHPCDFGRRRRALPRVLPHRAEPQRDMAAERAVMQRQLDLGLHRGLVFAPLLPVPRHDRAHRLFGDVFEVVEDVDHIADVLVTLGSGGEAEAAIAVDRGGRAIGRERLEVGVPPDAAVPVVVGFDQPRGDKAAGGIDRALALSRQSGPGPISVIRPSATRTSARYCGAPEPSTTVPPLIRIRISIAALPLAESARQCAATFHALQCNT